MTTFDKHLPKPISLNTLPLLSLREAYNESSFQVFDGQEYIPTQDLFRPDESGHNLSGTITGGCEPFQLRLRGINRLPSTTITMAHTPVDGLTLPILAASPPTWLALSNFTQGNDKHTLCFFPSEARPLMTFDAIYKIGLDNPHPNAPDDHLEHMLESGFHILILDFTRRRDPGIHTYTKAADFWKRHNSREISPLDIFKIAA